PRLRRRDSSIRTHTVVPPPRLSAAPHASRDVSPGPRFRSRLALVELARASGQAKLDLGMVAGEVNAQRDERVTLLLHLADQARDLLAVQQELARTQRVMVHDIALSIRRDVNVLQPRLAVVDSHETIAKVGPSVPDRLHLRPGQHHLR